MNRLSQRDLGAIDRLGAANALKALEDSEMGESFRTVTIPQRLDSSSVANPQFRTFMASQVKSQATAFLSKHSLVSTMIEIQGDIHYLVPKDYLRKNGINDERDYNQVANYAFAETAINIRIGNRLPVEYLGEVLTQIETGQATLGEITSREDLDHNFEINAVPESLFDTTVENYSEFLQERRTLMAAKLREYYQGL